MEAPAWADEETKHMPEGMQALLTPSPSPPASGPPSPGMASSPGVAPPPPGHAFPAPRRPSFGAAGRPISLRANHLEVSLRPGYMYCYRVTIQPSGCPRRVNREIVATMVEAYSQVCTSSSSSSPSSSPSFPSSSSSSSSSSGSGTRRRRTRSW